MLVTVASPACSAQVVIGDEPSPLGASPAASTVVTMATATSDAIEAELAVGVRELPRSAFFALRYTAATMPSAGAAHTPRRSRSN